MSSELRQAVIEQIIETNYYLTQAIFRNDFEKIRRYKGELNHLINGLLNNPIDNGNN